MRIGIDLDNTIIQYDALFHALACEQGLIDPSVPQTKQAVRAAVRDVKGGYPRWVELQGLAYGREAHRAQLAPGVKDFLAECRLRDIPVHIISHKTMYPRMGPQTNLQDAAQSFLEASGLLHYQKYGLTADLLTFRQTRIGKLAAINACGVSHFIDDLIEVLSSPGFPRGVQKILLAEPPAELPGTITVAHDWKAVFNLFFGEQTLFPRLSDTPAESARSIVSFSDPVAEFEKGNALDAPYMTATLNDLIREKMGEEIASVHPRGPGRNSRSFRVVLNSGNLIFAKQYYARPGDLRDRGQTEFAALSFLNAQKVDCVPNAISLDPGSDLGLYSFIEGEPADKGSIGKDDLLMLARFARQLTGLSAVPEAQALPEASEACFALYDHIDCVEARWERLVTLLESHDHAKAAVEFLVRDFKPVLTRASRRMEARALKYGLDPVLPIQPDQRILSPSDFGFHNAIRTPEGRLVFVDFEYFGWDDPAKLVADVFHQPTAFDRAFRDEFLNLFLDGWNHFPHLAERIDAVTPLQGLKWCLIMLNEFLPHVAQHREFVQRNENMDSVRQRQLHKATDKLHAVVAEL